ncbi:probable cytochrome P450 303a1 [Macrosteles quadrilineatus]|uniref:probable cytochrome P450 303a1 n=1 Tax=Macrosteles quadrilineatus TaxID=74068 RepID=UPI0023E270A4|nr:probable cytochrome P450 303a1 [Macrosteles quadrilineatus]XP_054274088.1 probable cytochrome P450 303a1 [Macrosteles quadrilineatus]XP_054274089.1 probable cytochrome P450 303a1 [Macrosteles quadrilineatus]XP_054277305.1 probable cytochrome P450 303a1 [Macrosteles quadrilineatus]XP_054277306.1 probable cytochrome P450 303a1 [Macrosteles quadrilineatus]
MWIEATLFIFILGLLLYLDSKKPKNFPPGPVWWPVVGSALAIHRLRKEMGGYLYLASVKMAEQYKTGCVGLRIGKDRTVVCTSYEAVREMMMREDFDGRPHGPFYETRTWGVRRGLILTDEEFWQEQKRFVLRHLREFGFGRKTMAGLTEDEAAALVESFEKRIAKSGKNGILVEMSNAFNVCVLNTLWSMLAGIRYNPEEKELQDLQTLLTELFANIDMVGALFSQFPVLQYLAPEISGYNKFMYIHKQLWKFLRAELDSHKASFVPDKPRDLMDVYLQMLNSPDRKPSFSEDQLLAICLDMFMAGSETTSKSLAFCFLYMLLFPDVQKKAQEEIDRVVGRDRLPNLNDRPNMPYMEAVVLESVRMFVGRTFGIPHRARKDTTLQGYDIPKDTMLVVNFNSCMMNEKFWEDPHIYRPERFLKNGVLEVPEFYIPFGLGKHRCIGQTLARSNVFLFTSSLLQRYDFCVPPGQAPPSTKGVDGATPGTGLYTALVKPRVFT